MGTTKSGRYLNTKGSARTVSDYALIHSSEGAFVKSIKEKEVFRLDNGGHSQKGLELLKKLNIEYNITGTYSNGVRVGNVPNHKKKLKRIGNNQSWFPSTWNDKDIRKAGDHVAGLKSNRKAKDGETIYGNYKGVRVGVIKTNGKIGTVFPDSDQSKAIRRKRK